MAEVTEQNRSEFPPVSMDSWRAAVESGLRGKRLEDKLTTTTSDGIVIQPLYGDRVDSAERLPWSAGSWSPQEILPLTDPGTLRARMQRAVEFGVTGFRVGDASEKVESELASIARELGAELFWTAPVDAVRAIARLQDGAPSGQALAPGALSDELAQATPAESLLFTASSSDEQSRGAGVALQVAVCLARGAAWLREGARHGISASKTANQLEFQLGMGTDLFLEVAKLRALRLCWTRLLLACESEGPCRIHVQSSPRSWTVRDPWVNGLRGTTIAIAAAIGGANSVLVLPFDALLGESDEEAMRLARNTHAILAQESHLDQVLDPAAGSGYIESLTQDIAQGAWVLFQEIERLGAESAAFIEEEIELSATADAEAVATRRSGLIGVSEFPNLDESLPERDGSSSAASSTTLAAPFETLRARSDKHLAKNGTRPTAFLCNFGLQAEFRPRSGFASNLLAAGGIAVLDNDGFASVSAALDAYQESKLPIAVIASTDDHYAEHVMELAAGLKERGATVVLAGKPRDKESDWTAAGVDTYIYLGCDALSALGNLQEKAGVSA
jgi:heterodimeric-type methylmalonyl-CoA mutase beta chain